MLKENLKTVEERIQSACKKAGRKREEITLIAVSKTKPPHMLQEAYDLGVRIFGENKVQEIREKYEVLPKDIDWHMIGHLQTNKVKYIVDKVKLIHSVDSFKLGEVIEKEAAKQNRIIDILLEVNVAQESSKSINGKIFAITTYTCKRAYDNSSICRKSRRKPCNFCRFT